MKLDAILRIGLKLFFPFIIIFGFYVHLHGDYGPGGGFQAGVIIAASIIFYSIIFGLEKAQSFVPPIVPEILIPLGVFIYAGYGILNIIYGGNYLEYTVMGHEQAHAQEWGIFWIELGVLATVTGTMLAIFYAIAGRGR